MSKSTVNFQTKHVVVAVVFVVCCTAVSFGFSHIFPQGERRLANWQLSHMPAQPIAQSIVFVRAKEKSPALCGEGRWNLNVLQATFLALHQAGALVVAPMIDASMPIPSECGGLSGFVQLAEVTKHVGSVVYPDSVPPALAQAAVRTGSLGLPSHEKGKVGGFTFHSSSLHAPSLPFGVAVASFIKPRITPPTTHSFLHVPSTLSKNGNALFSTQSFTNVWKSIQTGKGDELARLFQGKAVFLYLDSSVSLGPSAAKEASFPVAFLHAKLANAYLADSWMMPVPILISFFMAVILGCLMMVPMLGEFSPKRLGIIRGAIAFLASAVLFLGYRWNWVWPLFSMGLGVGLTIVGMGAWRLWQSRSTVQQRIVQGEQQLTKLEHELSGKQHHVRQLEEQLSESQHQTNRSVTVIEALQISQNTSLSQLDEYQEEVQETRRKIESLQEELHDLRQHVPVTPAEGSSEALTVDHQDLIQECETFQIVTRDYAVLQLFHNLKKAAVTQVPILLLGETGTGKEVFAKAAHALRYL